MLLPVLFDEPRPSQPFLLLQSTAAQSIFPVLRTLCNRPSVHTILCTFLYAPSTLLVHQSPTVQIRDWTDRVPGYGTSDDFKTELLTAVKGAPRDIPLRVVIDSLETLSENLASSLEAYELLYEALRTVKDHPRPSQLILHSLKQDETSELFLQTTFSSSLIHLVAHPTALFRHLAKEYMVSPPPMTPDVKFWSVFIPFSERLHEVEKLFFGPGGEGSGGCSEIVIEIIVRGINAQSRKRGTERSLEGWDLTKNTPCAISDLHDLQSLFSQKHKAETAPDPVQSLSFNLSKKTDNATVNSGAIFYDPDSADDIDDDDPDEDLDI
ncbi:hypothetical protein AN958_04982 [Leucoagaricus sp. SymC.cos]|nr:hypothetical protein AN958_04982 [Leucoagaricus sp. SymC.cos]